MELTDFSDYRQHLAYFRSIRPIVRRLYRDACLISCLPGKRCPPAAYEELAALRASILRYYDDPRSDPIVARSVLLLGTFPRLHGAIWPEGLARVRAVRCSAIPADSSVCAMALLGEPELREDLDLALLDGDLFRYQTATAISASGYDLQRDLLQLEHTARGQSQHLPPDLSVLPPQLSRKLDQQLAPRSRHLIFGAAKRIRRESGCFPPELADADGILLPAVAAALLAESRESTEAVTPDFLCYLTGTPGLRVEEYLGKCDSLSYVLRAEGFPFAEVRVREAIE